MLAFYELFQIKNIFEYKFIFASIIMLLFFNKYVPEPMEHIRVARYYILFYIISLIVEKFLLLINEERV